MSPRFRSLATLACAAALAASVPVAYLALGGGSYDTVVRPQPVRGTLVARPRRLPGRGRADRALGTRRCGLPLRRLARDAHAGARELELTRALRARAPRGQRRARERRPPRARAFGRRRRARGRDQRLARDRAAPGGGARARRAAGRSRRLPGRGRRQGRRRPRFPISRCPSAARVSPAAGTRSRSARARARSRDRGAGRRAPSRPSGTACARG